MVRQSIIPEAPGHFPWRVHTSRVCCPSKVSVKCPLNLSAPEQCVNTARGLPHRSQRTGHGNRHFITKSFRRRQLTGSEQRELGVLATKMANLEQKFEEHRTETREHRADMRKQFETLEDSVQQVLDRLNGWRGGWKAMMVIGAAASALTTMVLQIIPLWHK